MNPYQLSTRLCPQYIATQCLADPILRQKLTDCRKRCRKLDCDEESFILDTYSIDRPRVESHPLYAYFQRSDVLIHEHRPFYLATEFLCEIGGVLGLWFGSCVHDFLLIIEHSLKFTMARINFCQWFNHQQLSKFWAKPIQFIIFLLLSWQIYLGSTLHQIPFPDGKPTLTKRGTIIGSYARRRTEPLPAPYRTNCKRWADEYGQDSFTFPNSYFNQDNCYHDCKLRNAFNKTGCIDSSLFRTKIMTNDFYSRYPKCPRSLEEILYFQGSPQFAGAIQNACNSAYCRGYFSTYMGDRRSNFKELPILGR